MKSMDAKNDTIFFRYSQLSHMVFIFKTVSTIIFLAMKGQASSRGFNCFYSMC